MDERKTVAEIIRFKMEKEEISVSMGAKWIGVAQSTFSMKLMRNTFSAEEARLIFENLGMEIVLLENKRPVNREFGGIGPKVRQMVNRVIYDTSKSIALCHTGKTDGWMMELFVDQEGRFFVAHYTTWAGTANMISEIGKEDAKQMYEKYGDGMDEKFFA